MAPATLMPGLGNNEKAPMGMQVWHLIVELSIRCMSEHGAHTKKKVSSHLIVVSHPYTWENYNPYNYNTLLQRNLYHEGNISFLSIVLLFSLI